MSNKEKHKSYNGARVELLELDNFNFSHKTVLDVGCYQGANATYLKDKFEDVKYIGLEGDQVAIANVYSEVDKIYEVNLDQIDFMFLDGTEVDFIILGDVIEHLKEPDIFMSKIKNIVNNNTKLIVSIPNIQYYETFLQLITGHFPRRERGIFDKTHLRWFTNKEFRNMVKEEYDVIKFSRSFRLVDGNCCASFNKYNKYAGLLFYLCAPFFTYQLFYVLKPKQTGL